MQSLQSLLDQARDGLGLKPNEALRFLEKNSPALWDKVYDASRALTLRHFQKTLRFFAPLYFSSICVNDCAYCGFKRSNTSLAKKTLDTESFLAEARWLWNEGHRSILLVAAEHPVYSGALRIARRLLELERAELSFSTAIEVGPLKQHEYRDLAAMGIQRCVLYQETYNRTLYQKIHLGPKEDFDGRYEAPGRALAAGISQAGIGFLAGLSDYKPEVAALIAHALDLKKTTGIMPATFALPRLTKAEGSEDFLQTTHPVADDDFEKIIALLKLALPECGMVLSTRESPAMRDRLLRLGIGVTHISAGVSTQTGGYAIDKKSQSSNQFEIRDTRSIAEMVNTAESLGYHVLDTAPRESIAQNREIRLPQTGALHG